MKNLTNQEMQGLQGGMGLVEGIGSIACGLSLCGPIGLALGGPTCVGMIVATMFSKS